MASVTAKLLTAEEYRLLPPADGTKTELVRGKVVKLGAPGLLPGLCQVRVSAVLDRHVKAKKLGRVVMQTGVVTERNPDTVRGPNLSYWSAQRLPLDETPVGYPALAPDLTIEVLSPTNSLAKIRDKMSEYFERGVRMVWIVNPEHRTLTIYRSLDEGIVLHAAALVQVDDVLPEFHCRVADLFA